MPWRSQAQRRKFFADPKLRKYVAEFAAATPKGAKLPERVHPKKGPAMKPNSKAPLGQGGRFAAVEASAAASGARNPAAVAAVAGRKKYGPAKMAKLAKKGKHKGAPTRESVAHEALDRMRGGN